MTVFSQTIFFMIDLTSLFAYSSLTQPPDAIAGFEAFADLTLVHLKFPGPLSEPR